MVTSHPDPGSPDRSEPAYAFDFCGGQLAIDFTNTVGSRGDDPSEHFSTFGDVVAWAEARGIIRRQEAAALRREATAAPERARRAVHEARELREALYRVLDATVDGKAPQS